jgi:hypothetical protein
LTFVSIQNKIAFLLLAAMLFGAGYWAYQIWKISEAAASSCLHSIVEVANKAAKADKLRITDKAKELTEAEIEQLLENQSLDCRDKSNLSREVHIAVGDVNEHTNLKIKVWTNGYDEVAGTDDDLVVPLGEKVK